MPKRTASPATAGVDVEEGTSRPESAAQAIWSASTTRPPLLSFISEPRAHAELHAARLAHGGDLAERRERIARVRACAEGRVACGLVRTVEQVECLDNGLETEAAAHRKRARDSKAHR